MKHFVQHISEEYELHDAPLIGLQFDFEQNEITVSFDLWDSFLADSVVFKMIFGGVYKFVSEVKTTVPDVFNPDECYGWTWTETEPGRFEAEFYFFSEETGWTVTIGFTSLRTEGGLSEEARAARAAYLQESGD